MADSISIETTIPEAVAKLEAMRARVPAAMDRSLAAAAVEVRDLAVQMMRSATPRRSGKGANSTTGEIALDPDGATITVGQPAESEPDQSGNWGGIHYLKFVWSGRAAIRPPFANKKALFGPGLPHPMRGGVAAAPANNYPARVRTALPAPIGAILMRQGGQMTAQIVSVMRG